MDIFPGGFLCFITGLRLTESIWCLAQDQLTIYFPHPLRTPAFMNVRKWVFLLARQACTFWKLQREISLQLQENS